ncbi:MAG: LysE family translocator [bacterium]
MIDTKLALSFAATITALVVTPGTGFVLFSRTMLTQGRRAALAIWAGIIAGTIALATIVVLAYPYIVGGVAGLRHVLQIAGGLYLLYLGVRGVQRARHQRMISAATAALPRRSTTTNELAIEGVASALTNPGLLVIYVLLLPSFVPAAAPWTSTAAALAAEHITIMTAWYFFLFVAIGRARGYFSNDARQAGVAIASSLVLILLGVRTLFQAWSG